jgi:hypothetical protein
MLSVCLGSLAVEVLEEIVGRELDLLCRHSAARYWQAIKPVRCTRRKSP